MNIELSIVEQQHQIYGLPFNREEFARAYANSLRQPSTGQKPASQRDGFVFTDLNAQDAGYNGLNDIVVVAAPDGIVGIGPWALIYIIESARYHRERTKRAA